MNCPKCKAPLSISIELDTDYLKLQTILAEKASASEITNEQLADLKWKQSAKREALSTILVNETSLAIPILKLLYERLSTSANKAWKLGEVTYKLSRNDEGTEWLQRWTPVRGGS